MPEVTATLRVRFLVSEDCEYITGGTLDEYTVLTVRGLECALIVCPKDDPPIVIAREYADVTVTDIEIE